MKFVITFAKRDSSRGEVTRAVVVNLSPNRETFLWYQAVAAAVFNKLPNERIIRICEAGYQ